MHARLTSHTACSLISPPQNSILPGRPGRQYFGSYGFAYKALWHCGHHGDYVGTVEVESWNVRK